MRNVKTWGILFLCLLLLPGVAYAQKRQIEGTVISQEDKEPLIGATVIVKGSLSGAETDLDGHFTLEVDPDAKFIIVDYIGMKQTQVPIPKNGILNVALQPEAMNLDEVVVTGYGNFSRSSFTGSANTLRADLLKEMPVVSIEQKLQGMTSGVNITGSSGQPGANASIRIRGMGSFNASNEPLFVIDGVPVTSGNLSTGSGSEASYMNNAKTIYTGLKDAGYEVYGGINAPYIWLKTPENMTSWDFFDFLLEKANVVGTPGSGFGPSGEGYFRLTAFGSYENSVRALERIKNL